MFKFKHSKIAKAVSGFVGLTTAVMMMGPAVASAATVEELTAQINALLAQVSSLQATANANASTASCSTVFAKTLKLGMSDAEVKALQGVLNGNVATQVAASGVGSKGMETSYFGGLTKAAVIKFQEVYASDILTPNGLTKGTGLVGASTRAKLNSMCSSSSVTPVTPGVGMAAGVTATLDATSPLSSTLITPQGVATLAVFKIANGNATAAKVTALKFKRVGISSDSTLNNVYLYNGSTRLTDSASVSQGNINFADSYGIVTVPAMSSVAVAVRADIASGMNGQTLGVMLTDATVDTGTVGGLPISGAQHTFATAPSGMATADFTGSFSPNSGTVDPQNDYIVFQKNLNVGNRDALLSSIRLQQIGSVYADDVKNFRLMVDGVQVGTAVDKADANRFVTFTFATPVTVKAGNHTVKVMADIVAGSGRNFKFSLRRVVDVEITDSQLSVSVTPTVAGSAFAAVEGTSAININAGSLTVSKDTTSPSGNVVLNGSGVSLAKFKFKAQGEELKVENLAFTLASTTYKLRSAGVYADGVQIGSTQDLLGSGTTFNLGSSLILPPGKDVVVEVRADVYNNAVGGNTTVGDAITVTLASGSSNVYQRQSLGYIGNSAVTANQLTVASGSLTLSKYTAYANQTVVVPQGAYKIGDFRMTTGSTEGVNVDTLTLALGGSATVTNLTDVYVVYGTKTTQSKATGAASQTFSVNEAVAANTTMTFAVYATLNGNITSGQTVIPTLTVSGTSQASGNAVQSAAAVGQTVEAGTGALTVSLDASSPVAANVVQNSMPKVGSFKFVAQNDSFTITELGVAVADANVAAAISGVVFKDGATELKSQPLSGLNATATGLSVAVPYNTTKIIDVYANLGSIGTGFATTSANVGVTLMGIKTQNSNGVASTTNNLGLAGSAFYAFKTKPTISNVALPIPVLTSGTMTIGKISITSDAGGPVAWDKIVFNIASSTPSGNITVTSANLYDDVDQTTALGTCTINNGTGKISCAGVNKEVSGSKTYVLKATLGGTGIVTGASLSTSISAPSSHVAPDQMAVVEATGASFVWSDESVLGHGATTADWMNDHYVKSLPTDSQSLTK